MTEQKAPPMMAFPANEIRRICKTTEVTKILASSYIQTFARGVDLEVWELSQMPLLIEVYSYSNQLCDFLNRKIENPTKEELLAATKFENSENAIPFLYEEIIMMTGVVKTIDTNKNLLLLNFNLSLEAH